MAKIKRFAVLKTAWFLGLYSFFVGLLFSIIMWLLSLIFAGLFSGLTLGFISSSLIFFILFPIVYGVASFVLGLIVIPIINLTLKIKKGINLDLELGEHTY